MPRVGRHPGAETAAVRYQRTAGVPPAVVAASRPPLGRAGETR